MCLFYRSRVKAFLCIVFLAFFLQACSGGSGGQSSDPSVAPVGTIPFITVWKTDNRGLGDDNQIVIQTVGDGYNYAVDWGDGNVDNGLTGNVTHTYAVAGTYTVAITGDFPQITTFDVVGSGDASNLKLLSVEQWGNIRWRSMEQAFEDSGNLVINATDAPDLSQVTSTWRMFLNAENLTGDLSGWDVGSVIDMSLMFSGANSFIGDLSNWNVSSVTNMESIFEDCELFNSNLSGWNTSSVTNMESMFSGATNFNQNISSWDVSAVTNMRSMFESAIALVIPPF